MKMNVVAAIPPLVKGQNCHRTQKATAWSIFVDRVDSTLPLSLTVPSFVSISFLQFLVLVTFIWYTSSPRRWPLRQQNFSIEKKGRENSFFDRTLSLTYHKKEKNSKRKLFEKRNKIDNRKTEDSYVIVSKWNTIVSE